MAKYRYRIESGHYGGEVVIGEVSNEFVKKAVKLDQDELIEFLTDIDDDYENEESEEHEDPEQIPIPKDDYYMWECDDLEHLNGPYSDGTWHVHEVPTDGSADYDFDKEVYTGESNLVYGREGGYFGTEEPDLVCEKDDDGNHYIPVLAFHSSEKGSFGCWFLDTDEPFEKDKLAYGICETNVAELVDRVYYNKEELDTDYDYNDTTGKAYYASTGWLNTKWHDAYSSYNELDQDLWDELDDNIEWEKQNGE